MFIGSPIIRFNVAMIEFVHYNIECDAVNRYPLEGICTRYFVDNMPKHIEKQRRQLPTKPRSNRPRDARTDTHVVFRMGQRDETQQIRGPLSTRNHRVISSLNANYAITSIESPNPFTTKSRTIAS